MRRDKAPDMYLFNNRKKNDLIFCNPSRCACMHWHTARRHNIIITLADKAPSPRRRENGDWHFIFHWPYAHASFLAALCALLASAAAALRLPLSYVVDSHAVRAPTSLNMYSNSGSEMCNSSLANWIYLSMIFNEDRESNKDSASVLIFDFLLCEADYR